MSLLMNGETRKDVKGGTTTLSSSPERIKEATEDKEEALKEEANVFGWPRRQKRECTS